jgi:biotin-dependent carboxylase-like uncharacterized protein
VLYGGAVGPDLEAVAAACGLSAADVIRLHSEPTYQAFMLGFSPGWPYLGLLSPRLRLPRRASPRARVPAGSVAIADLFTGVYPQETPGGWHLLGRTRVRLFDPDRDPPFLIGPGDRVRFVPMAGEATAHPAASSPDADGSSLVAPALQGAAAHHASRPARPVFEVLEPGLLTTVQDLGRTGWRRYGVPGSGALDRRSCVLANLAVGNAPGAAAIECTFPGPRLRVLDHTEIAVAGADLTARINGATIGPGDIVPLKAGDVIDFAAPGVGQWAYLAVTGGLDAPPAFGSRATYARGGLGGPAGRPLRAGDALGLGEGRQRSRRIGPADFLARRSGPIRVIMGPQAEEFTAEAQAVWLAGSFDVTVRRDRSGMRLRGPALGHRSSAEILSDGLLPGAVQVPAEGQPIVILADGPTTGGYPKIAWVIGADLDRLAQVAPGTALRFEAISVAAAHEAWAAYAADFPDSQE